jgi:probable HAF family extracellular repeat protein
VAVSLLAATAATAVEAPSARATAGDVPIAVPRDLGTGTGTASWSYGLAGRVVVGRMDGVGLPFFQYDLDTPGASMQVLDDQGFYPSSFSSFADADGPYVVGTQQAGTASQRAFVFDLRSQVSTQIPGLGGMAAYASAVDRGVVVGGASTSDFRLHAFAYDVEGAREVIDLGTLGGPESTAYDVSGTTVVGKSDRLDGTSHAFAVDLDAPGRPMTDLGTLGGAESAATEVSGDVVAGWAEVPGGAHHAFAVRVPSPSSGTSDPLVDLGTLGGDTSYATGVDGNIVVGASTRADGSTGVWWADMGAVPVVLHDIGTVGAGSPAVAGGRVIGTRQTSAGERGFVLDVATGSFLDLDPLPGHVRTAAADVGGDVVVGTSYAAGGAGTARATAWTLGTVASPSFRLARKRTKVSEGTTARIKVVRSGDVRQAVDVRYRVSGTRRGATAGKDFRKRRGVVRFEAGQVQAFIRVRIRDDRIREGRERARVRIRAVTPGTTVTAPRKAWLVIRASDRRSVTGGRRA